MIELEKSLQTATCAENESFIAVLIFKKGEQGFSHRAGGCEHRKTQVEWCFKTVLFIVAERTREFGTIFS
jgi:hypothetical protein